MQQNTPLSSASAMPHTLRITFKRGVSKLTMLTVALSAVLMSVALPMTAHAEGPQSCDMVAGSVLDPGHLNLNLNVTNPAADSYDVVLYNQGPIGVQTPAVLGNGTLNATYNKVDIGYAGRRAVESGVSGTYVAAISPLGVAPTPDNSTFCTGTVSLVDNATDGTAFVVNH
jgi:hypothetical protein